MSHVRGLITLHMGGCQNYGTFLGTLNNRCRSIIGTQKGTINLDNHPFGGSWAVTTSGVISPLIGVIIIVTLFTTPEPP